MGMLLLVSRMTMELIIVNVIITLPERIVKNVYLYTTIDNGKELFLTQQIIAKVCCYI